MRQILGSAVLLPQAVRARRPAAYLLKPPVRAVAAKSLAGSASPIADVCCRLGAEPSDTLKEVQTKNEQLRVELRKSRWPELRHFSSNGRNYILPLRAESRDSSLLPSEAKLAYLAGFFDGDGCVACQADLSGCVVQVAQSFDQAEVLMLFFETFGGSIALQKGGLGLCKPTLRWLACGQSARRAAQLLAPQSITKREQLLLASQWPAANSDRLECRAELRALKEYDSAVTAPCSWEYLAGFFDAEGNVDQQHGAATLVVQIVQKHPRVLKYLRDFLARRLGKGGTISKSGESAHVLRVCGLTSCNHIMQQLLAAGLLRKAKQAKLVLGLTSESAAKVSAELGDLAGNQKFGRRLDTAGHERARKIKNAQAQAARLKRRGQIAEAMAKLGEVEVLKEDHQLLKACRENQQLLEYMHRLQSLQDNSLDRGFAQGT